MLSPGGLALVAGPYRVAAEGFPAAVEALGLRCENSPLEVESEELGRVQGTVHRVTDLLSNRQGERFGLRPEQPERVR